MAQELHEIQTDELIATLENDFTFYQAFQELVQQALPYFFSTRKEYDSLDVAFGWQLNFLSFSVRENTRARMGDLVRGFERKLRQPDTNTGYKTLDETHAYFFDKLCTLISTGEATLNSDTEQALSVIYANPERVNIAAACRTLGKTRGAVQKLVERYSADMYVRYQQTQQGKRYDIVMGDCRPFIHDHPVFDPVVYIDDDSHPDLKDLLTSGALVADRNSSLWYDIEPRSSFEFGSIWKANNQGLQHFPCKVLPAQYRAQAAKFCSRINGFYADDPRALALPESKKDAA